MTYEALARKLRPRLFDEIVGQDHITTPLKNAVITDRIHHGYLFTGTRGVGKTTAARIFARAINCGRGKPPDPCNSCEFCKEVMEGHSTDVLEIDGASNTGIDDVRRLRENSIYVPARGRFRVNIIDEVHMLSRQAFNGLLKILEEPPPHLVFIFATTEPHRIPETVISRMIRFDFRLISEKVMESHLAAICEGEGIEHDGRSLSYIAGVAEGSVRDGISILEQCALSSGGIIEYDNILEVLGVPEMDGIYRLADALIEENGGDAIRLLQEMYGGGIDLKNLYGSVLGFFRRVALLSFTENPDILESETERLSNAVKRVSGKLSRDESLFLFDIVLKSEKDILASEFPLHGFEAMLLRVISFRRLLGVSQLEDIGVAHNHRAGKRVEDDREDVRVTVSERMRGAGAEKARTPAAFKAGKVEQAKEKDHPGGGKSWDDFLARISGKKKFVLKGLLENMSGGFEGDKFFIRCEFDALLEKLKEQEKWNIIKDVTAELLGKPAEIVLEKESSAKPESGGFGAEREKLEEKVLTDPVVIELLKEFPGSRISSIRKMDPVKEGGRQRARKKGKKEDS